MKSLFAEDEKLFPYLPAKMKLETISLINVFFNNMFPESQKKQQGILQGPQIQVKSEVGVSFPPATTGTLVETETF